MKRTEIFDSQTRHSVPIKWLIEGHENDGWRHNLGGKFFSLSRLRPLLRLAL
ncbi:MAG: hypothetical protein IPN76_03530 [Saprospiraceae bacterium]|nr:hypothetical protein [Saprospiraceae bacterium]